MNGKTVLITGATGAIGSATARELALRGAHVVIGARDAERGAAVVAELRAAGGSAEVFEVDLASLASIRSAAANFSTKHMRLDVLVNNAGVFVPDRSESIDGFELTWATNFLGVFLLTRTLLPVLRTAHGARVVNVGSDAHRFGRIAWNDLQTTRRRYTAMRAYSQSKLGLILVTRELARREPGITANVIHPGALATPIWRHATPIPYNLIARVLPSAVHGAAFVARLAAEPDFANVSGRYFDRAREVEPSRAASNDVAAGCLWGVAERAVAR